MRLELTMSTKEDEDVFKTCIEEIIEEGFTLETIRTNASKVKSIIRIEENPQFQKGTELQIFDSTAVQKRLGGWIIGHLIAQKSDRSLWRED